MEVVQHQHQRMTLGCVLQEGGDGIEEAEAGRIRLQGRRRLEVGDFVMYLGNDLGNGGGATAHICDKLFRIGLLDIGPHGLGPGPVDTIGLPI